MSEEMGRRGKAVGAGAEPVRAERTEAAGGANGGPGEGTITRRGALKVIAAGAALGATVPGCAPGDGGGAGSGGSAGTDAAHTELSGFNPLPPSNPRAAGTLTDPDMLAPTVPWEMVLTDEEMRHVAALADVIIPADDRPPRRAPSASPTTSTNSSRHPTTPSS